MAFTEGVRPGGLSDSREIKILICYMLMGINSSLSRDDIRDILMHNEIANMFEVVAAMDDLVETGRLVEDDDQKLSLTEEGKISAQQLVELIPYTLRDQALRSAMQLVTRSKFEQDTKVDIEKLDNGYSVTCAIDKTNHPMMSFTLRVTDELQAENIKDRFLNDPTAFYSALIALSTGDYNKEDGNIIISNF